MSAEESTSSVPHQTAIGMKSLRAELQLQRELLLEIQHELRLLSQNAQISQTSSMPLSLANDLQTPHGAPTPAPRRLEIGQVFDPMTHYDSAYYADGAGLEFLHPALGWRVYKGPSHSWDGFDAVVHALAEVVANRESARIVDIGCGSGDFVCRAAGAGLDAFGVDLSEAAIRRADAKIRDRLICADVTLPNTRLSELAPVDVTTSWDFWEHISESDLEHLIRGVCAFTKPGGLSVNCICTSDSLKGERSFPKGVTFSADNSWALCSGHVNIRQKSWWLDEFSKHGFKPREDLAAVFHQGIASRVDVLPLSWSIRNMVVIERIRVGLTACGHTVFPRRTKRTICAVAPRATRPSLRPYQLARV
jgi:cyclopropane fatty-acyl-phospholipid synthase-like methyltransferase